MKNPHDIILRPVMTEKSFDAMADKRYVFEVAINANKIEIKQAVEAVFGVKVASVNTLRTLGKIKRQGRYSGRTPEIKKAYKEVEHVAAERLLGMLPDDLRESFRPALIITDGKEHQLVKAADKLSAYIKCIEERRAGNDEFISAEKQTLAILDESPLPEVKYFLEHFIPAFELNLDQLGTM